MVCEIGAIYLVIAKLVVLHVKGLLGFSASN